VGPNRNIEVLAHDVDARIGRMLNNIDLGRSMHVIACRRLGRVDLCLASRISRCRASQREIKSRSTADLGLGPYAPAMAVHDALHRGEPDPGTGKIDLGMQALECAE
jgi:hypothetical protein